MADDTVKISFQAEGNAEEVIRSIRDGLKGFGEDAEKATKKASSAFEVFQGTLAANIATKALSLLKDVASAAFDVFITQGIKAASDQEEALNKMNTALAITGQYSEATSKAMEDFASEIENTTKFSDDATLAAAALIQQLGSLDRDGLKKATKAATDLSAALGIDLQSAAQLVGKAAAGEVGSLSRYGISIEKAGTKAETAARALDAINKKFGGSAQSDAQTYAGALAQLGNKFNGLQEEIGFVILNNKSLANVLQAVGKFFDGLQQSVKDNRQAASDFVSKGIVLLIQGLEYVVVAAETATIAYLKLQKGVVATSGIISAATNVLTLGLTDAGKRARESAEEFNKLEAEIARFEKGDTVFTKMQDALAGLEKAATSGLGQAVSQTNRYIATNEAAVAKTTELSDKQKKLIDKGVELANTLANKEDPNREYVQRVAALQAALTAQKISLDDFNKATLQAREEREAAISEIERKSADTIIAQNQELMESDKFKNEEAVRSNQEKLKALLDNEKLSAKDRANIQKEYNKVSQEYEKARYQAASDTLNALATLQNAKTKEIAAVGKAAAIAQATIDTYKGATGAAAALAGIPIVGPALATAAAAAFIAAGLFRVAQISGVELATGITEVPAGYPNDTFPARLTSGERVVDAGTNQDLKGFLAGSAGMVVVLEQILNRLSVLETRVTVNVGSRTIVNEVREGLRQGFVIDA